MRHIVPLVLLMGLPTTLFAKDRPAIVSPEVRTDRSVVFRLWAPQASDVQLSGDWMGPRPPVALTKGRDGVWMVTVGPMDPNVYTYGFLVDGVRASDPSCRCSLTSAARFSSSSFVIPADPPRSWERQNHVAGTLHHERFFSNQQRLVGRFVVYTPPGYESSGSRQRRTLRSGFGRPGSCDTELQTDLVGLWLGGHLLWRS
jgi:Carbohydrate-binding module 48 (Isoamylase N-terminal domain)